MGIIWGILDLLTQLIPIVMTVIFIIFIGVLIDKQSSKNRESRKSIISSDAIVISKRKDVRRRSDGNDCFHTCTTYYATFELEGGERIELEIPDGDIGYIMEEDIGQLRFEKELFWTFDKKEVSSK